MTDDEKREALKGMLTNADQGRSEIRAETDEQGIAKDVLSKRSDAMSTVGESPQDREFISNLIKVWSIMTPSN